MKHLQLRNRRFATAKMGVLLCLVLAVSFTLAKESYQDNLESFIRENLEQGLGVKLNVEVIEGGIIHNMLLRGVSLSYTKASPLADVRIEAEKVSIDYNIWDLIIKKSDPGQWLSFTIEGGTIFTAENTPLLTGLEGQMVICEDTVKTENLKGKLGDISLTINGLITSLSQDPRLNLCLEIAHPYLEGSVDLKDSLFKPSLKGSFNLFNNSITVAVAALGYISDEGIHISRLSNLKNAQVEIHGFFAWSSDFRLFVKLDHLSAGEFDIVSDIKITGKITQDKKMIKGEVNTASSIVNHRPFKEVKACFELTPSVLEISSFEIEDNYSASGRINLAAPYEAAFSFEVKDEEIDDMIALFGERDERNLISGLANGEFKISGPLRDPDVKGHFDVGRGNLGDIEFDSAGVNFLGRGLLIQVTDSRLFREGGFLQLEGEINLAAVGDLDRCVDLRLKRDQETVAWKGWDITRRKDSANFSLQKKVNEDCVVSVITFTEDESRTEDANGTEFGLEYTVLGDKSIKMQLRETEESLVLEHKLKF